MPSTTELKRLVKTHKNDRAFVVEHGGEKWVTNSYWLVQADRVRALFDHYNLGAMEPGRYEVNGKVSFQSEDTPNCGSLLDQDYEVPLEPVTTPDGGNVFVRVGDRFVALLEDSDGTRVGVGADYLDWLTDETQLRAGYGRRVAEVELRGCKDPQSAKVLPLRAVGVFVTYETQSGGHNGEDGRWIPATWTAQDPELAALVMPIRLG